jgi:nitroreductase
MLEGITTTRAIRRFVEEPVPPEVLRAILFAATRGPSGSNRQPFRFLVLTDGPKARAAKAILGEGARRMWDVKRSGERYDRGSGAVSNSRKARVADAMQHLVDRFEHIPAVVLACFLSAGEVGNEGSAVWPACQNLLLAARALGYGGVLTGFHFVVKDQLQAVLGLPDTASFVATIPLGKPAGHHGPVRRRPLGELVFQDSWGNAPAWAVDPPGTEFTSGRTPVPALSSDRLAEIEKSIR